MDTHSKNFVTANPRLIQNAGSAKPAPDEQSTRSGKRKRNTNMDANRQNSLNSRNIIDWKVDNLMEEFFAVEMAEDEQLTKSGKRKRNTIL